MNNPRISISGRFLRVAQPTGTQRSSRQLLFATIPHVDGADITLYAPNRAMEVESLPITHVRLLPGRSARYDHLWEQFVLPTRAKGGVIWTLMGSGPCFHPGSKHVMVVHDLNFLLLRDSFSTAFRLWYLVACAQAARNADIVVCFTDYVKETIIRLLGVSSERIRVIPQGPGLAGLSEVTLGLSRPEMPDKYFLCVGSLQPHKNLKTVLEGWHLFSKRNRNCRLLVVGRKQARFKGLTIDSSLFNAPGIEFTGYVGDEKLVELYQNASGFLYPSLEEGFGLPIVEAFYCGCPVVTANRSCLPEVAGGAAILVDPLDPHALAASMEQLLLDQELVNQCRDRGLRRSQHYSWCRAGRLMAEILQEIS